jgi:hypothetical protein
MKKNSLKKFGNELIILKKLSICFVIVQRSLTSSMDDHPLFGWKVENI